jgi:hypothetical protein
LFAATLAVAAAFPVDGAGALVDVAEDIFGIRWLWRAARGKIFVRCWCNWRLQVS